jgi:hypothetical protein
MINYIVSDLGNETNSTIKTLVQSICKENKINYEKQEYHVLFSNESMLLENNDLKFTSGSKNILSFYGKIYLNKKGKIIENIFLDNETAKLEPQESDLIVIRGGIDNSTVVEIDQELLYFYVAPSSLLKSQQPNMWQTL